MTLMKDSVAVFVFPFQDTDGRLSGGTCVSDYKHLKLLNTFSVNNDIYVE